MIICGFAGIGKSTVCKNYPNWIDLESTPFEKDWDTYTRVASHMDKQGYNVMLSCHEELRKELHRKGIEYVVVMPKNECKKEYIQRYINRGNTDSFIKLLSNNWELFTELYDWETVHYLEKGEYLSDALSIPSVC